MAADSTDPQGCRPPDPALRALYLAAEYEVTLPGGPVVFRIGEAVPGAPGPFAVITAWNPGRERPSREVNQARGAELERELTRRGLAWLPAEGRAPDGSHHEPSVAVFGIELEAALELARQFGQAAIVWYDGEAARLAWC
jgi:hypothetical protein